MNDVNSLLVANLLEAFKQLNQYLALGIVAAVSALSLEFGKRGKQEPVQVVGGFSPLSRDAAQLLTVGISFVVGLMGSYAADAAVRIAAKLSPSLLAAACTSPSVVTAPILVRALAVAVPAGALIFVLVRKYAALKEKGVLLLLFLMVAPYILLGAKIVPFGCPR